jgi:hypothetical protein
VASFKGGKSGPELVIRGKHPVVAMPVLPRRRHEIGEPVEELKRRELDDAIGSRPRPFGTLTFNGYAAGHPRA